jgi:tetratricopeptide (TPR) repeat protein
MPDAPTEVPPWTRSAWVKWSWLLVLIAIVAQSLNYHWRVLPTSAAGYFARGKGDYLIGEYASAAANFTKSLVLRPNDADTHFWRGEAYVKLHDLANAMPDLAKAVALRPDYAKAHAALANGESAAWDTLGAIAEYSRAIALDPNFARCFLARGRLLGDTGRWDDAAADLNAAARLLLEDKQGPADLLLWVARARGGDAAGATAELSRTLKTGRPGGERFRNTARFLCGELTEPAYLAAMTSLADEDEDEARAEAFFFAGEMRLLASDREGAVGLLREALKTGARSFYAYDSARVELESLRVGLHPKWLDEARRHELWLASGKGLEIVSVAAGSAAMTAGIRPGAVLATIAGDAIDQETFVEFLWKSEPGSMLELGLIYDAASRERVPVSLRLDSSAPTR